MILWWGFYDRCMSKRSILFLVGALFVLIGIIVFIPDLKIKNKSENWFNGTKNLEVIFSQPVRWQEIESKATITPREAAVFVYKSPFKLGIEIRKEIPFQIEFPNSFRSSLWQSIDRSRTLYFTPLSQVPEPSVIRNEQADSFNLYEPLRIIWPKTVFPDFKSSNGLKRLQKNVKIQPHVDGQWQFLNDRGIIFTPLDRWPGSQIFTLDITSELTGKSFVYEFQTETPKVITLKADNLLNFEPVEICFNQIIELGSLSELTIDPKLPHTIKYKKIDNRIQKDTVVITPNQPWKPDRDYVITLPTGIVSKEGPNTSNQSFNFDIQTQTAFALESFVLPEQPLDDIKLVFTSPVNFDSLKSLIALSPSTSRRKWARYLERNLNGEPAKILTFKPPKGYWEPDTTYVFKYAPELVDIWGRQIKEPFEKAFIVENQSQIRVIDAPINTQQEIQIFQIGALENLKIELQRDAESFTQDLAFSKADPLYISRFRLNDIFDQEVFISGFYQWNLQNSNAEKLFSGSFEISDNQENKVHWFEFKGHNFIRPGDQIELPIFIRSQTSKREKFDITLKSHPFLETDQNTRRITTGPEGKILFFPVTASAEYWDNPPIKSNEPLVFSIKQGDKNTTFEIPYDLVLDQTGFKKIRTYFVQSEKEIQLEKNPLKTKLDFKITQSPVNLQDPKIPKEMSMWEQVWIDLTEQNELNEGQIEFLNQTLSDLTTKDRWQDLEYQKYYLLSLYGNIPRELIQKSREQDRTLYQDLLWVLTLPSGEISPQNWQEKSDTIEKIRQNIGSNQTSVSLSRNGLTGDLVTHILSQKIADIGWTELQIEKMNQWLWNQYEWDQVSDFEKWLWLDSLEDKVESIAYVTKEVRLEKETPKVWFEGHLRKPTQIDRWTKRVIGNFPKSIRFESDHPFFVQIQSLRPYTSNPYKISGDISLSETYSDAKRSVTWSIGQEKEKLTFRIPKSVHHLETLTSEQHQAVRESKDAFFIDFENIKPGVYTITFDREKIVEGVSHLPPSRIRINQ